MDKNFFGIALSLVPGVGSVLYKNLIDSFKRAEAVFDASLDEIGKVKGVGHQIGLAIKNFNRKTIVHERVLMAKKAGAQILILENEKYPKNLSRIHDPPSVLYIKGEFKEEDEHAVAVVGSRNPSKYGVLAAGSISRNLAKRGVTIVSGLARGIDAVAHNESLLAKGRTIAVLGNGIDIVYPPENRGLFKEICKNGAVVSEFPISTPPDSVNFPKRNRIISGLSLGVVVVEAGQKSGSLITSKFAKKQNRRVFAVPGSIDSLRSKGTNRLIKDGADLVENSDDILKVLIPGKMHYEEEKTGLKKPVNLSKGALLIMRELNDEPVHIDTVITKSGLNVNEVSSILMNLELCGFVTQLPGKYFVKTHVPF